MTVDPNIRGPHNTPCQHCGAIHGLLCPWVSAYEYHPDGSLKRVEFRDLTVGEWVDTSPAAIERWIMGNGLQLEPARDGFKPGGIAWVRGDD